MTDRPRFELLGQHDRTRFSCGEPALDRYFREVIGQDVRSRAAVAYVAIDASSHDVIGYYTMSATSVDLGSVPDSLRRRLPRYPLVPGILIGRMAVARSAQGKGLGGLMLIDAGKRVLAMGVGAVALVVRPKNDAARRFYLHQGFQPGQGIEEMLLPMTTLQRSLGL